MSTCAKRAAAQEAADSSTPVEGEAAEASEPAGVSQSDTEHRSVWPRSRR